MYRIFLVLLPLLLLLSCRNDKAVKDISQGNLHYDKGEYFYSKNLDSAYFHLNKARSIFESAGDSRATARSLMFLAIIQTIKGDYFGSNETTIEALAHSNTDPKSNKDLKIGIYNQLGLNYESLKDFKLAEHWYVRALNEAPTKQVALTIKHNLGVVNYEQGKYKNAIEIFQSLLKDIDKEKHKLEYAFITDNLAYVYFLSGTGDNVAQMMETSLKIREELNNLRGQFISHEHLATFYQEKNAERAIHHAHRMLEAATRVESPDDQLKAYEKLILLDKSGSVKDYFARFQQINDSLQTARAIAKNQFALIRYEADQQKIENVKKQNQILKLYFGLLIMSAAFIYGIFLYRKRKKILEQQKELELNNTRLKYSKKVHDVVANGLYQTMMEVGRQEKPDKEKVLEALEKMYEESRDISHDSFDAEHTGFAFKVSQMLSSYSSAEQKVLVVENSQAVWDSVPDNVREEVFLTLRELMTNMRKHSAATRATVKFERTDHQIFIKYSDNGVGLDKTAIKSSGGILNTENRIVGVSGKINFEKNEKGGLTVIISIPLSSNV